ncbi:hypothetical protein LDBUL1632_00794 [Lactobacillus delbrueckii subsp. bulgaricus CNCM I-1632]|nr:hypothetical protein LDBUL1632_00794 [Lactobacillus delbrueckii subsp. bulgaricus CNCM I-1632]
MAPDALTAGTSTFRVPALDHEVADHPVESYAVVVALLCQADEVFNSHWCFFWEKLNDDVAVVGLDSCLWALGLVKVKLWVFRHYLYAPCHTNSLDSF